MERHEPQWNISLVTPSGNPCNTVKCLASLHSIPWNIPWGVMECPEMLHGGLWHVMVCHGTPWYPMTYYMGCHGMPWHSVKCFVTCHGIPWHISWNAIKCFLAYHSIPWHISWDAIWRAMACDGKCSKPCCMYWFYSCLAWPAVVAQEKTRGYFMAYCPRRLLVVGLVVWLGYFAGFVVPCVRWSSRRMSEGVTGGVSNILSVCKACCMHFVYSYRACPPV